MIPTIKIKPFHPDDQDAVKRLVLDGLVDHWGFLDPVKNPDLNDIKKTYQDAIFLVIHLNCEIVGCGALVPKQQGIAEIVRMSVHKSYRRNGFGSMLLKSLLDEARRLKLSHVVLETTTEWAEVVNFYLKNGFQITHYEDGNVHFIFQLNLIEGW